MALSPGAKAYKESKQYEKESMHCAVCEKSAETHHIYPRGMGSKGNNNKGIGCDCKSNRVPLCRKHHQEAHDRGAESFFVDYSLERVYEDATEHYYARCRGETSCTK